VKFSANLDLDGAGGNSRFLEDRAESFASSNSIVQDLIVCVVPRFARQIVELPLLDVNVRTDPSIQDQIHRVVGHFLAFDCDNHAELSK
jgi:hypothetical protein